MKLSKAKYSLLLASFLAALGLAGCAEEEAAVESGGVVEEEGAAVDEEESEAED